MPQIFPSFPFPLYTFTVRNIRAAQCMTHRVYYSVLIVRLYVSNLRIQVLA